MSTVGLSNYESFPSSTMALMDDSTRGVERLSDLQPLRQRIELLNKATPTFVLMNPKTSAHGSDVFSLIFCAILVITLRADGAAPPVVAQTSRLKELFSTSMIRDLNVKKCVVESRVP